MIRLVLNEKKSLSESCKAIAEELEGKALLADGDWNNRSRINKLLIDISLHLGNIAGFCDRTSKEKINKVNRLISISMVENMTLYNLKLLLPIIAGIQVDFYKRPFKLVNISVSKLATIEVRR
jgi:hypothetical protein